MILFPNQFLAIFMFIAGLFSIGSSDSAWAAKDTRESKKEVVVPTVEGLTHYRDQKKWPQLSAQLERVPPALRNEQWKKMLDQTALGLTEDFDKLEVPTRAYFESDDLLIRYPDLAKNDEFMKRRRIAGLKFFDNCFQNKNNLNICTTRLKSFAEVDHNDAELQFGTGKLTRSHIGSLEAIPYFDRAMTDRSHVLWCKDSDVKLAITSGLQLPAGKQGENVETIKQSNRVAFNSCWSDWQEILLELYAKDKVHYQHNVCNQLRARGVLTPAQVRQCPKAKIER